MVILTDLSEVLIKGVYGIDEKIEKVYGKEVGEEFALRRELKEDLFCVLMRGKISEDIFWKEVLDSGYDWPFGINEIKEYVSDNIKQVIPGTLDVFEKIIEYPKTTDYISEHIAGRPEIWVVSDHIRERREEIEALHPEIFELTAKQCWSFEYGMVKRDVGFFDYLLYSNHLQPNEVIFIDDQISNTHSANRAGISDIMFFNAKWLKRDLRAHHFRFSI